MAIAKTLLDVRKNYTTRTFLWALGLAIFIFGPWMIFNDGYFLFYGDFNVQQIPFNQMIHDSVRDGNMGWSYTTDLGANIIGSYSFYNVGSPFFWLTMAFPSEAVPYLIAPLLMLKFALAATGAYVFLRRYVKNQNYAVYGALMYAFSGFSIYNIFFNHFHEAMVIFPFLLAAIDSCIYDKKKGVVAFTVFVSCMMNYYFFVAQAVFIFIYWMIRVLTGSYRIKISEFFRFAAEVVIGFGASAVLLLPSVYAVLQNSRVQRYQSGWSALVYPSEQKYLHIFETFFFPPDMPAYSNFTPDSNAKWTSIAGWLPLFSMMGVFSFFKLKTHKWLRIFIPMLAVIAFVPVFNSMFQLFNSVYYARWFYMMTLMFVFATVISLDNEKTDHRAGLIITFIITLLLAGLVGFMPVEKDDEIIKYGLEKYPDRFWIWVGLSFLGLALLMILMCLRKRRLIFVVMTGVFMSILIIFYANTLIGTGVLNASYRKDYIIDNALNGKDTVSDLKDINNVRSDFYDEMDNMGMFWQIPSIQAFQSIVPGSVMDFYPTVGVERSVGSRPKTDIYAIRSFLSVKYLFDNYTNGKSFASNETHNVMPGWKFIAEKNDYKIYENEYYIPYGFTYDTYVTSKEYYDCPETNRSKLLLKSIVLTDEQAEKYKDILKHDEKLEEYHYTQNEYFSDCEERKKLTCSSVEFENNCITAEITTGDSDELVFFSIPYEEARHGSGGWTAEVNGEPVDIEKVNVGFMAVRVPANKTSTIVFRYSTPGLTQGAVISLISLVLFILYMIFWKVKKRETNRVFYYIDDLAPRKKKKKAPAPKTELLTDEVNVILEPEPENTVTEQTAAELEPAETEEIIREGSEQTVNRVPVNLNNADSSDKADSSSSKPRHLKKGGSKPKYQK